MSLVDAVDTKHHKPVGQGEPALSCGSIAPGGISSCLVVWYVCPLTCAFGGLSSRLSYGLYAFLCVFWQEGITPMSQLSPAEGKGYSFGTGGGLVMEGEVRRLIRMA